jgi:hypothetical protein
MEYNLLIIAAEKAVRAIALSLLFVKQSIFHTMLLSELRVPISLLKPPTALIMYSHDNAILHIY